MKRHMNACIFVSLLFLCHCKDISATTTPEGAYRAFAVALRKGDTPKAYAALSQATRKAVEARSKALAAASQGLIQDKPALMIFQSGTRPMPVSEATVVEQSDGMAVLEVAGTRVRMVREGDNRWAVDLAHLYLE